MLLSEDAAKQRWCPFARSLHIEKYWLGNQQGQIGVAINRDSPSGNIPACIASHCMAWRFAEPKQLKDIDLVTSDVVDLPPRLGYCGLSGKPEHGD